VHDEDADTEDTCACGHVLVVHVENGCTVAEAP
jgi:hypothetical protein